MCCIIKNYFKVLKREKKFYQWFFFFFSFTLSHLLGFPSSLPPLNVNFKNCLFFFHKYYNIFSKLVWPLIRGHFASIYLVYVVNKINVHNITTKLPISNHPHPLCQYNPFRITFQSVPSSTCIIHAP